MAQNPDTRTPGEIIEGKYKILKLLSNSGGLSTVYLVEDVLTGREWALKEYRIKRDGDEKTQRFTIQKNIETEARYLQELRIRGIPFIRDVVSNDRIQMLVMEYFPGESLSQRKAREGALPEETVRLAAAQICDILKHLHNHKPQIIHRDIKPANIMIRDNMATLIDFGTLREYKDGLKRDQIGFGTEEYAPPEMSGRIKKQTDGRSDIFSLGVTIYELLTGTKRPQDIRIDIHGLIQEEMLEGSENPAREGLLRIAEKCTRKDPERRFQTVEELKHALAHADEITHDLQERSYRERIIQSIGFPALIISVLLSIASFIWRKQMDDILTKSFIIISVILAIGLLTFIVVTKILKKGEKRRVSGEFLSLTREYDKLLLDDDDELDKTSLLVKRTVPKRPTTLNMDPDTRALSEDEDQDERTILLKYRDQKISENRFQVKSREVKKARED